MKQKLLNKFWLRVGMIVAVMTTALAGTVMADEYTIGWGSATGAEGSFTNFTANSGTVNGLLSFSTSKNSSLNEPLYSSSGKDLRLYYGSNGDGGSLTFALVSGVTITGFELTTTSTTYTPTIKYTVDLEASESVTTSTTIYTVTDISATSSLKIQNANTTNTQLRIKTIKISYTISGDTPTTYNVTFDAGDGTFVGNTDFPNASNTVAAGTYTLPSATRDGYTFDGWLATGSTGPVTGSYTVSGDVDFTASYTQNGGGGETGNVDVLNWAATGSPTNYSEWTYTGTTGAAYAGQSSGTYQSIQLRSNNNNSGIVTTTSAGNVTKVTVTWNGNTQEGRTLNVYGKNTAYSAAPDLYETSNQGTLLGTIVCGTSTELVINGNYAFIGLRSASSAMYLDEVRITWETGATPNPSFTITNNSEIAYDATSGTFTFTVNNPVDGGTTSVAQNADWISNATVSGNSVSFTTTENEAGAPREGIITLTYSYGDNQTVTENVTVTQAGNPNAPGSVNNPYTVAQARAAIDANTGTQDVYATGIVSEIPTAWSSGYNNITFNFVDTEGDTNFLQAYRCVSTDAADASTVAVGDIVVVKGNLTKYGSTYEFGQGCTLVSLTHPTITEPSIDVNSNAITATASETTGTITVTYNNITDVAAEVFFCDAEGGAATYDWLTAEIDSENNLYYMIGANTGEARTAYMKVYALDDDANDVYSELITITQAAYVAPPTMGQYALATSITSGKKYVIASGSEGTVQVMAEQRTNNRGAIEATVTDGVLTVSDECEFVITGNETDGYTIYDENDENGAGYLYAANSAKNWLMTQTDNNVNGIWTITIDAMTGEASVVATGSSNRNVMHYNPNNGSPIFSCYASTSTITNPVYFYEKVYVPETITLNASGYATFASTSAVDFTSADGYSAWAVTGVNASGVINCVQITGAVAAGTGVLLKGTANDQVTIAYTTSGATLSDNKLVGFTAATEINSNEYFGLSGAKFVKVNGGTVPAGKALLPASVVYGTGDGVKTLTFNFDEDATAIKAIDNGQLTTDGVIYNVAGQRLSKMQKGINIVNGKKILK